MVPDIFREYDIRGIAGEQMTEEDVLLIGKGIGTALLHTPRLGTGCRTGDNIDVELGDHHLQAFGVEGKDRRLDILLPQLHPFPSYLDKRDLKSRQLSKLRLCELIFAQGKLPVIFHYGVQTEKSWSYFARFLGEIPQTQPYAQARLWTMPSGRQQHPKTVLFQQRS